MQPNNGGHCGYWPSGRHTCFEYCPDAAAGGCPDRQAIRRIISSTHGSADAPTDRGAHAAAECKPDPPTQCRPHATALLGPLASAVVKPLGIDMKPPNLDPKPLSLDLKPLGLDLTAESLSRNFAIATTEMLPAFDCVQSAPVH